MRLVWHQTSNEWRGHFLFGDPSMFATRHAIPGPLEGITGSQLTDVIPGGEPQTIEALTAAGYTPNPSTGMPEQL